MEAYLDNSATTRVDAQVQELMKKLMDVDFGNPSSRHQKGVVAEGYIKEARQKIAATLKVDPKELIITSGGTESNSMALIGTALAAKRKGNHIITTAVEHPSVKATASFLEEQGFRVTYLPVDAQGRVSIDALREALDSETILVSVMYANNEIGTVEPIEEIGQIVKQFNPEIVYHVDAIQAYGKFKIVPKKLKIDLLSVSGHKIHGPKGTGFLYVKEKTKIKPIILGGGQQKAMRSGTENVPGIAGLGVAAGLIYNSAFDEKIQKMYDLRSYFIEELQKLPDVTINGCMGRESAPHIVSASFRGVRAEVLLHALEDRKIYVSSGSACSSNHASAKGSHVLNAMGLSPKEIEGAIRFSFSEFNTIEEMEYTAEKLKAAVQRFRRLGSFR